MTKTRERTRRVQKPKGQLLKQLAVKATGKSGGRNSGGCITSFHRGGGSKRLQRNIDLKRDVPATGVVERIEYDANRSSRVALVRWIDGVNLIRRRASSASAPPPPPDAATGKAIESPTTAAISSAFSFASLPGRVDRGFGSAFSQAKRLPKDYVLIGAVPKQPWIKQADAAAATEAPSLSFALPRIAVAGAKPAFFASRTTGDDLIGKNTTLSEIQRWKNRSIERKSAIPWQSLGLEESKPGFDLGSLLPPQLISYALSRNSRKQNALPLKSVVSKAPKDRVAVSYIIASDKLEEGKTVMNCDWSKSAPTPTQNANTSRELQDISYERLDLSSQPGNCLPLSDIRMGTWVHDIECRPGQGAKLVRAAGTYAKVVKHQDSQCLLKLPSGVEKLVDSRCRATVGTVSNPDHGAQKLRKAGQNRWLGWRPVVRGVAMNPIDHPHGGGEGRTSGGRPSVSPWGKPTKAGFKTVLKVVGKGRV